MDELRGTHEEVLAKEAAAWIERLKTAGPKERAEFARWLRQSPAHVREALLASSWELVLHYVSHGRKLDIDKYVTASSTNIIGVDSAAARLPKRIRALRWPWVAAMAASVAIAAAVLLGALPLLRETLWHEFATSVGEFATSVGEQRSVALLDGSVISLNARSRVRVEFSTDARDVYLDDGQALFSVAHDSTRPFRVHAGRSIVQAIGTKFDVHRVADRVDVAVLEGRVQVASDARDHLSEASAVQSASMRTQLTEGESLSIGTGGTISAPVRVDVEDIGAWRQRRLVFRDRPLAEIVEEFQRYNRIPLMRVEGKELRARTFNGVFDADDPQTLVAYLATDNTIAFERRGDELVIRPRPMIVQSSSD
jgi:transmembrane sensor